MGFRRGNRCECGGANTRQACDSWPLGGGACGGGWQGAGEPSSHSPPLCEVAMTMCRAAGAIVFCVWAIVRFESVFRRQSSATPLPGVRFAKCSPRKGDSPLPECSSRQNNTQIKNIKPGAVTKRGPAHLQVRPGSPVFVIWLWQTCVSAPIGLVLLRPTNCTSLVGGLPL